MADTEVWDLGGPIAAPAAADRVPIATGANSGGYSLRSDFAYKNASGQYVIGGDARPVNDGVQSMGTSANRWSAIYTATVDRGAAGNLQLKAAGGSWNISASTGSIFPLVDNSQPLGGPVNRPSVIYAASGTINTSDEREKTWRGAATVPELAAAKRIIGELGFFQWNDSIVEKGAANARYHFGVRAQQVWAIMADEGLIDPLGSTADPTSKYAFLCCDRWDDHLESRDIIDAETGQPTGETETVLTMPAGDRFGIRPDQLALFLIAAQQAMIDDHETRLAALEGAA